MVNLEWECAFAAIAYCKELDWLRTCVTTLCEEILLWFILSEKLPQTGLRSQNKERQYLQILNWRVSISICFFSALSIRSLAWSLALAERPLAGQWTAPGSSHWRATQSRYWHHFGHQLTHHFGHTPQPPCTLKKGHDTFRVYILHRDIRTERTRGDAYEFAPEAMHESVPEARPLPAQHSANHS